MAIVAIGGTIGRAMVPWHSFVQKQQYPLRTKVKDFILNKEWDMSKLYNYLPRWICNHIAAYYVERWLKQNNIRKCTVELDSLIVIDMFRNKKTENLSLKATVEDTIDLVENLGVTFGHCYREATKVADFLAKYAANRDDPLLDYNLNQMPARSDRTLYSR
ncbi:hypothetical protein HAX54_035675 [Datura stramonium]|uniref:RNase H type-1 domain-containing protein n=1 Tax=Datura stramonium TaxID=4076 RepID=A0ABS8VFP5_DATST|nr:hypothetical protein [Datura stramonium]